MELEEEALSLSLRVAFERGGFGNPTRKEGKMVFLVEVEGESEMNEDIIEFDVNTILLLSSERTKRKRKSERVCVCVYCIARKKWICFFSSVTERRIPTLLLLAISVNDYLTTILEKE